ncbi:hypothetical protein S101446_00174 [Komagataeibacter europaeus]|nr:hypothetical protein S101446_00174 [Komagataeibacter europaeus]
MTDTKPSQVQSDGRQKQGRGEARGREDFAPTRWIPYLCQTLPCQLVKAGVQRGQSLPLGAEDTDIAQHGWLAQSYYPRRSYGQSGKSW